MSHNYPTPPYPSQQQSMPGSTAKMDPRPDHGEDSYKGSARLNGMKAVITGGDSGIGRAVAIAYAREGADILIAYLSEHDDAEEVKKLVEKEGRKAVLVAGDIQRADHCRAVIKAAIDELGGIDILVNNAAHQATVKDISEISDEEWELTFKINIHAMFYLTKAAVPHMKRGRRHREHSVSEFRYAEPDLTCLCDNQGCHTKLYQWAGPDARGKRHQSERSGAGADLDAAHSIYHVRRKRLEFWEASAHEACRAASGARDRLCDACRSSLQLHVWDDGGCHWRQTLHMRPLKNRDDGAAGYRGRPLVMRTLAHARQRTPKSNVTR